MLTEPEPGTGRTPDCKRGVPCGEGRSMREGTESQIQTQVWHKLCICL